MSDYKVAGSRSTDRYGRPIGHRGLTEEGERAYKGEHIDTMLAEYDEEIMKAISNAATIYSVVSGGINIAENIGKASLEPAKSIQVITEKDGQKLIRDVVTKKPMGKGESLVKGIFGDWAPKKGYQFNPALDIKSIGDLTGLGVRPEEVDVLYKTLGDLEGFENVFKDYKSIPAK